MKKQKTKNENMNIMLATLLQNIMCKKKEEEIMCDVQFESLAQNILNNNNPCSHYYIPDKQKNKNTTSKTNLQTSVLYVISSNPRYNF